MLMAVSRAGIASDQSCIKTPHWVLGGVMGPKTMAVWAKSGRIT